MSRENKEERFAFYCEMLEQIEPEEVDEWVERKAPGLADVVGDGPAPASVRTQQMKAEPESRQTDEVWPSDLSFQNTRKTTIEAQSAADRQPAYAKAA
jgi:hypothetical protein